jgi:hypothetical protein
VRLFGERRAEVGLLRHDDPISEWLRT